MSKCTKITSIFMLITVFSLVNCASNQSNFLYKPRVKNCEEARNSEHIVYKERTIRYLTHTADVLLLNEDYIEAANIYIDVAELIKQVDTVPLHMLGQYGLVQFKLGKAVMSYVKSLNDDTQIYKYKKIAYKCFQNAIKYNPDIQFMASTYLAFIGNNYRD